MKDKTATKANKIKELILYGFFGAATTAINIFSYIFFTRICRLPYTLSNGLAWGIGVVFAYYTNSKFVFGQIPIGAPESQKQFIKFIESRVLTGVIDMLLMIWMVSAVNLDDRISKIFINIIVIVLNYVFSKIWIFKKEKE